MTPIPLHGRAGIVGFTVIDDPDVEVVSPHRWWRSRHGYAVGRIDGIYVRMHRLLLDAPAGMQVDHINGDRLDNRRSNLRLVTAAENSQNHASRAGASRYRGVYWHAQRQRWTAQVKLAGKRHYLGLFDSELAAARAAADFRREHMPHANPARDLNEKSSLKEAA